MAFSGIIKSTPLDLSNVQRAIKDMRRAEEGITHGMEPEELMSDRNQKHFVFNSSLLSRIRFEEGMEAESSLWNVRTG